MQLKVVKDWHWADQFIPEIRAILAANLAKMIEINIAPREADITAATDLMIVLSSGDIAVRVRRADCRFRDLTIRAARDSGAKTELAKIREGSPRWYFYGWEGARGKLAHWIIVDLAKVRALGLLDNRTLQANGDGTWFISIPGNELFLKKCLVAYQGRRVVPITTRTEGAKAA